MLDQFTAWVNKSEHLEKGDYFSGHVEDALSFWFDKDPQLRSKVHRKERGPDPHPVEAHLIPVYFQTQTLHYSQLAKCTVISSGFPHAATLAPDGLVIFRA